MSSKTLLAVLFLLGSTLPAFAEKPNDNRSQKKDDSRSSDFTESGGMKYPDKVGGRSYADWKRDLTARDPSIRTTAIRALVDFGGKATEAVPEIVHVLRLDGDASCRVKAAQALRMLPIRPTDHSTVIKGLAYCIGHDPQAIIRYEATMSLRNFGRIDGKAKDERDAVVAALVANISPNAGSSTYELRESCIYDMIIIGPDAKTGPETTITDALVFRANGSLEPALEVRLKAIMALGALGRPQDPRKLSQVLNVLNARSNLNSSHKAIRIWSHVALMSLEEKLNKKYLETVSDYLKDEERETRIHAVLAFGALEEKAQDYVDKICDMMRREKDNMVLESGCQALGHLGNQGERVITTLINLTEDDDNKKMGVVLAACSALSQIGLANKEVLDAMNKLLERKSLPDYHKMLIRQYIKTLQNPPKKDKKKPGNSDPLEKTIKKNR